jgi:hypothetical protein
MNEDYCNVMGVLGDLLETSEKMCKLVQVAINRSCEEESEKEVMMQDAKQIEELVKAAYTKVSSVCKEYLEPYTGF